MTFTEITDRPAGLAANQSLFKTDALDYVLVTVKRDDRYSPEATASNPEAQIAVKVSACLVDAQAQPVLMPAADGKAVPCESSEVYVLAAAALASGKETIEAKMAQWIAERVQGVVNMRAGLQAVARLLALPSA